MPQARPTPMPDGSTLNLLQAAPGGQAADWAADLALGPLSAVVLVAGGDDALDEALRPRLTQLVARGLVRTLREVAGQQGGAARALCVARASGSGLPTLLGRAVADSGGAISLLGVAPAGVLALPGEAAAGAGVAGDPVVAGLSHLLITPGAAWGDELAPKIEFVRALVATPSAMAVGAASAMAAPRPMLLLIGGGPAALTEVLLAVRCGWPVLLVAGSGGAADALVRQIGQGEADGDDPAVAEILADGHLSCLTLGDKAAGAVEALARAVQRECGGNSVLRLAWQRFGALDRAAIRQQQDFGSVQGWILVLGVLVVAMSVLHSVGKANQWDALASQLRYALIVVPICVSALIVIGNRFSPGKRWVLLRAAAEALKREIYRYRVRPQRAPADGAPEKRLQQAMEDITRRLARTEVNSMGMPRYTGDIPPANAVACGDDGLSLLGTDRYVRLRLSDQLAYYGNKTARLDQQASRWQLVAIGVGALGTLLAALGDDWVSWVALTSAVASAAMAYLGYKQFETTLTSYNQTATDLENLLAWWTALLPDEQADPENVDKLVTTTEKVLADEQDGWAQNMTNALAALRTRQDEAEKPTGDKPADGAPAAGAATVDAAAAGGAAAEVVAAEGLAAEGLAADAAPVGEGAAGAAAAELTLQGAPAGAVEDAAVPAADLAAEPAKPAGLDTSPGEKGR